MLVFYVVELLVSLFSICLSTTAQIFDCQFLHFTIQNGNKLGIANVVIPEVVVLEYTFKVDQFARC